MATPIDQDIRQPGLSLARSSGSPLPLLLMLTGSVGFFSFFIYLIAEEKVTVGSGLCALLVWVCFLGSMSAFARIRQRPRARFVFVGMFGILMCLAVALYLFAYPEVSLSNYDPSSELSIMLSSHDSVRYIIWAERVADLWLAGGSYQDANMALSQVGLPLVYALLFVIFGFDPVIAILFNTLMVGLSALLTFELAAYYAETSRADLDNSPLISAILVFLSPMIAMQGAAIPMKEAIILFLLMLAVVSTEKLAGGLSPGGMIGLVCGFVGLIDMRFYMLVPVAVYTAIRLRRYLWGTRWQSIALVFFLLVAAAMVALRFSSSSVGSVLAGDTDEIRTYLSGHDESGSITATTFWRGDWTRVYLVPFRALLILFNPTPPIIFEDYLMGAESANVIFVILLIPFALYRVYQTIRLRRLRQLAYLIPLLVGLVVISASLQVCSPRFHIPLLPFLAILAAQGIVYCRAEWQKTYIPLLVLICLAAAVSYGALKALVSRF